MALKKLLVVVDFQRDFIDGSLGFAGAADLAPRIAEKIDAYHEQGFTVVYTMDTHGEDYLQTQEGRNLPIVHCQEGTPGWDLHPLIAQRILPQDIILKKPTFGFIPLFDWLRGKNEIASNAGLLPYESIEFCGLVSEICVISNVVLARTACPEVPIIVDPSCIGSGDEQGHEAALKVMRALQVRC